MEMKQTSDHKATNIIITRTNRLKPQHSVSEHKKVHRIALQRTHQATVVLSRSLKSVHADE